MTGAIVRRLMIRGRVQGVGFRYAFADEAQARGLAGWVRNRRDGSVEAMISGSGDDVEAMIAWARRGPPAASVSSVQVSPAEGAFTGFDIAPTA